MAQDTLSRLRVNVLLYDQHGCERMPEGMEARPSRVVAINKAALHETWPEVVLHELASADRACSSQLVRSKHPIVFPRIVQPELFDPETRQALKELLVRAVLQLREPKQNPTKFYPRHQPHR
jgi:hypothetical protein